MYLAYRIIKEQVAYLSFDSSCDFCDRTGLNNFKLKPINTIQNRPVSQNQLSLPITDQSADLPITVRMLSLQASQGPPTASFTPRDIRGQDKTVALIV